MNIPKGMEIDLEKSNIVYKPIVKSLAWEDLGYISGFYVDNDSVIEDFDVGSTHPHDTNIYRTKKQALASLAQAKLTQVVAVANDGWIADWSDEDQIKLCIVLDDKNKFYVELRRTYSAFLSFKTHELAMRAMKDNAQTLEEYKPLAGG